MPFPTTFYNMRYFVPLFALAALPIVRGLAALAPALRRGLLVAHGAVALALVAVFDVAPVYRGAAPHLPALEVDWIGVPLSLLDNLRMPQHLAQAEWLAHLDAQVPPSATLYLVDVEYYRDAQHGVYEHAGLIRADVTTRYVSSRDFRPTEPVFYVWSARPLALESLGRVEDVGRSLVRVELEL